MSKPTRIAMVAGTALVLFACNGEKRAPVARTDTAPADPPGAQPRSTTGATQPSGAVEQPSEPEKGLTMIGKVEKKPWSKSLESWRAGGAEYFVIHTDDGESAILRPSDQVSVQDLEAAAGKKVRVSGTEVPLKPYRPPHPAAQYPTGPDGKPLPTGGGIRVTSLEVLE